MTAGPSVVVVVGVMVVVFGITALGLAGWS